MEILLVHIWRILYNHNPRLGKVEHEEWQHIEKFNCFKSVGLELCVPLARTAGPNFSAKMLKFFYICKNPLKYVSTMTRNIAQATTDPSTEFSILIKSVLTRSTTFFKPQTFINANSRQYLGEKMAFRTGVNCHTEKWQAKQTHAAEDKKCM